MFGSRKEKKIGIFTFVVGLQLLPQLVHLGVPLAFLLFPSLQRQSAEIARLLVLGLLVGQLPHQRVLVVIRDAYLSCKSPP